MATEGRIEVGMNETFNINVKSIEIQTRVSDGVQEAIVTFEIFVYLKDDPKRGEVRAEFQKTVEVFHKGGSGCTPLVKDYDRIVATAAKELKCGFDRISGQLELIAPKPA